MMKQVSALVVDLINVGFVMLNQVLNNCVVSSDQGIFQRKKSSDVHLVYIGAKIEHLSAVKRIIISHVV